MKLSNYHRKQLYKKIRRTLQSKFISDYVEKKITKTTPLAEYLGYVELFIKWNIVVHNLQVGLMIGMKLSDHW